MSAKRKIAVLVGDGMGDEPVAALGGRTPLQVAAIPAIRRAAARGHVQLVRTVPEPGTASLALLGLGALLRRRRRN